MFTSGQQEQTIQFIGMKRTVLVPGTTNGGDYSLVEQVVPRSGGAPFLHTHDQTETFFVTAGQIVVDSTILAVSTPAGNLEALFVLRSQQHLKAERTSLPQEIFSLKSRIEVDDRRFPLLLSVSFPPDLDGDAMKRKYINTNLAEGTLNLINLCIDRDIDTIYFLDKSARPLAFLFRHTWQHLMPDVPVPQIRYINIGLSQDEMIEAYNDTVEQALQARFALTKPKHLLIADEYTDTGSSLQRAETVLRAAFPQAESITTTGIFERKIVSWYCGASTSGYSQEAMLGIRDKPVQNHQNPIDPYFIEPTRGEKDTSLRLRSELAQMASLIAEHACRRPRGTFAVKPIAPRHPRTKSRALHPPSHVSLSRRRIRGEDASHGPALCLSPRDRSFALL